MAEDPGKMGGTDNPDPSKKTETKETPTEQKAKTEGEQKAYTQSDLDRAISKALETREKNLKESFETEKLLEQKKYEDLWKASEAKMKALELERETTAKLSEMNLIEFAPAVAGLSSLEERLAGAKKLKEMTDARVEKLVAERLKTTTPAKGGTQNNKKISEMSAEEWKEHRKSLGIKT